MAVLARANSAPASADVFTADVGINGVDLGCDDRSNGLLSRRPASMIKMAATAVGCLALANCATSGDKMGRVKDPKYGVYASPRVVAGTQPIDPAISRHGVYMVGKPYQVAGKRYVPREERDYAKVGMASWYGDDFHGRLTANGEVFDMHDITAAHATMPLPSYARVTNTANGNSIVVRVNDRGPFHGGRVIDVSRRAAELLAFRQQGVGKVKVEYLGRAKEGGADEQMLMATLRTDGSKAPLPAVLGGPGNTMIAQADTPASPVSKESQKVLAAAPPSTETSEPKAKAPASIVVAYQSAPIQPAAQMPAAWSTGRSSTLLGAVALPPQRPIDLETIPNAATPIAADAKPLQIPSATARSVPVPQHIPLPPERSADAGLDVAPAGLLDGGMIRLKVADIVGSGRGGAQALAFAEVQPESFAMADASFFVDAGAFSDRSKAEMMRWVLAQSGPADIAEIQGQSGAVWRVKAGPFAERGDADAAAIMARNAGAAGAAVLD